MSTLTRMLQGVSPVLIRESAKPEAPISLVSRISARSLSQIRELLHALAPRQGISSDVLLRVFEADLEACVDLDEEALSGYVRSLTASAAMDEGRVPDAWGEPQARVCEGCGPVLLWADCPPTVKACPWCFRRRSGKSLPRPDTAVADHNFGLDLSIAPESNEAMDMGMVGSTHMGKVAARRQHGSP